MLDAYLDRVGLALPGLSTLAALREMLATHVATLPFGNLDMLFGRGISPWASARHEHCESARPEAPPAVWM